MSAYKNNLILYICLNVVYMLKYCVGLKIITGKLHKFLDVSTQRWNADLSSFYKMSVLLFYLSSANHPSKHISFTMCITTQLKKSTLQEQLL